MRPTFPLRVGVPTLLLACAACTPPDAGVGVDAGGQGGLTGSDGPLSIATAPWLALDLATGAVSARTDAGDLDAASLRDGTLLFRRIDGHGAPFHLAVFELTQAQWTRLGGAPAWTGVDPTVVDAVGIADDRPAYNLAWRDISDALTAWNTAHPVQLTVPDAGQWAHACAAGGSGAWTWGDEHGRELVRTRAVVWETLSSESAPAAVGLGRTANAWGLFDLHGNVWEWTAPGAALAGGSWRDALSAARTGNTLGFSDANVTDASAHALFGVRLLLRP